MQTNSKKSRTRSAEKQLAPQLDRFKAMTQEVGADESPGALDRSFSQIDAKKRPAKVVKPK